jgi:hypothetical protein
MLDKVLLLLLFVGLSIVEVVLYTMVDVYISSNRIKVNHLNIPKSTYKNTYELVNGI